LESMSPAMNVFAPSLPPAEFSDFSRVMQENRFWVEAAARRQVGDPALAEEVAQDVFLRLAALPGRPEDLGALRSWLLRCVWYLSANARRKAARRRSAEAEAALENMDPGSPHPPPGLPVEELAAALASLPDLERVLVLEYYFEGRSHTEIGDRHQLSGEATRKRIARALHQMRSHLERRGVAVPWPLLTGGLGLHHGPMAAAGPPALLSGSLKTAVLTAAACTAVAFPVFLNQQRKMTELQQQTDLAHQQAREEQILSGSAGENALWIPVRRETDPALFPDIPPLSQGFAASFSAWTQPGDFPGPLSLHITLTLTNLPAGPEMPAPFAVPPAPAGQENPPLVPAAGLPRRP
jgi:RNA polymerase sigma-70 factor, ECF subfamily